MTNEVSRRLERLRKAAPAAVEVGAFIDDPLTDEILWLIRHVDLLTRQLKSAYAECPCSVEERMSGHRLGCFVLRIENMEG